MACRRMGLLNDAIREHLELKRLRGADRGRSPTRSMSPSDPFAAVSRLTRMARRWTTITMSRLTTAVWRGERSAGGGRSGQASEDGEAQRSRTSGRRPPSWTCERCWARTPATTGAPVGPAAIGPSRAGESRRRKTPPAEQRDDDPLELEPDMPSNGESDEHRRGRPPTTLCAASVLQISTTTGRRINRTSPAEDVPEETTDRDRRPPGAPTPSRRGCGASSARRGL